MARALPIGRPDLGWTEKHDLRVMWRIDLSSFVEVEAFVWQRDDLVNLKTKKTDMKTAIYLMRCLTDLTMGDGAWNDDPETGGDQGCDVEEQLGEYDISSLTMMRELRRTLEENNFPHMDYVFGGEHFSFHKGVLVAYPGVLEDEGEDCVILEEEGWETIVEEMMGNYWSPQTQPDMCPTTNYNKMRTELEHLPVVRGRGRKRRTQVMNTANQPAIPADSCFVFFVNYDDDSKFVAFDQALRQESFVIGTDGGDNRGSCKMITIS